MIGKMGGSVCNPFSGDTDKFLKEKEELQPKLCSLYDLPENDQHHSKKHERNPSSHAVITDTRDRKKQKTSLEEAPSPGKDNCLTMVLPDSGPELIHAHSPDKCGVTQNSSENSPPSACSSINMVGDTHSSEGILQKYFWRPDFHQACNSMKIASKSALEEVLNNVNSSSFSATYGHEAATLINLWKLFDPRL